MANVNLTMNASLLSSHVTLIYTALCTIQIVSTDSCGEAFLSLMSLNVELQGQEPSLILLHSKFSPRHPTIPRCCSRAHYVWHKDVFFATRFDIFLGNDKKWMMTSIVFYICVKINTVWASRLGGLKRLGEMEGGLLWGVLRLYTSCRIL